MSDTMLSCPFCGIAPSESQYQAKSLWSHELVTWYRVYCSVCDIGMNECTDYEALILRWNHRDIRKDTITIPRDLFERLCEAAIEAEAQNRWKGRETRQRYVEEYQAWCKLKNEAVAIRDGEKQTCQHNQ